MSELSTSTDLLGPVAWRYVPSEVWADHVFTDDPERTKLAREYGRKVDALYTEEQMLARVAAERERGDSLRSQTLDLALMVGRLIRRMRAARAGKGVAASDEELERKCLDYLRRKGLTSPLRQEPPSGGDMTAILDVKRREWETLSPEAQAKLRAMTGDPGPEYRRQQALGAERARKAPLGGPNA